MAHAHTPTTLHLKAAVDATAAVELAPRVKAAVRDALKAADFADRVLFDEDALAGGVAGAVMAEILRIRQATPAESAQARAIERVRRIPRLPHPSEQTGDLGRAYTRGWESVISALDKALDGKEQ